MKHNNKQKINNFYQKLNSVNKKLEKYPKSIHLSCKKTKIVNELRKLGCNVDDNIDKKQVIVHQKIDIINQVLIENRCKNMENSKLNHYRAELFDEMCNNYKKI